MGSERHIYSDAAVRSSEERLEILRYMADMVSELQVIATRQGCDTLAGLLALAQAEAEQRANDHHA